VLKHFMMKSEVHITTMTLVFVMFKMQQMLGVYFEQALVENYIFLNVSQFQVLLIDLR
jgi:hypothetical protein